MKQRIKEIIYIISLPLSVYCIFFIIEPHRFGTLQTLYIMFQQAFIPSIVAWGLCFVMTLGLYDLSIGAIIILSSMVGTKVGLLFGPFFGFFGLILSCVCISVILELVNAVAYTALKIPSMIATIGLLMIYETVGNLIGGASLPFEISMFGRAPYNIFAGIITFLLAYFLFNKTQVGVQIKAVGGSEIISENAGINVRKVKIIGFLLCGLFTGIASFLTISHGGLVMPSTRIESVTRLFPPLMGYFIGVALSKICNIIIGIFIGEMVIVMIITGMITMGVTTTLQQVITGLFLLIVVGVAKRGELEAIVK
jgi:ribose transport system permease protein